MKNRYEIEAKTLKHRNATDEREATSATGQPKHALEAFGLKCWNSDEAGLTAQVLIEKYLVQRPGADGVPLSSLPLRSEKVPLLPKTVFRTVSADSYLLSLQRRIACELDGFCGQLHGCREAMVTLPVSGS